MNITPVASASPNGNVRIARRFRWIHHIELQENVNAEQTYREQIAEAVSERGIYLGEFNPTTAPMTIGSRRARLQEFGWWGIYDRPDYDRSARSRSHSRSKERRANNR